ncbi:MAG: hypothetical protein PSX80_07135 [bacterium]|nr:hypothetical protein [bacterium]
MLLCLTLAFYREANIGDEIFENYDVMGRRVKKVVPGGETTVEDRRTHPLTQAGTDRTPEEN